MDVDKSGSVSLEEFKAIAEDDVGADNSAAFFKWIEGAVGNADGELTPDEWVPFVLEQESGSTDEEFHQLVDDWLEVLSKKRRVTLLRQVFLKMDADSSGMVDMEEFANLKVSCLQSLSRLATPHPPPISLHSPPFPSIPLHSPPFPSLPPFLPPPSPSPHFTSLIFARSTPCAQTGEDDDAALHMVYHYLDNQFGNSDGELSMDEWISGMKQMGEEMDDVEFEAEVSKWINALTKNQRQVWRGCYQRGKSHQFVIAGRAAGATHVLFVQNANTTPPPAPSPALQTGGAPPPAQPEVRLTNRGSAQCMVARDEWFGRLPVKRVLLSSPLMCAKETALYMSGQGDLVEEGVAERGDDPLLICKTLGAQDPDSIVGQLVRQKGECPVRTVLDAEGGETAFGLYAEACALELTTKLRESIEAAKAEGSGREKATYITVFGHQTLLSAVAYGVATASGMTAEKLDDMLNIQLGEAEGILVPLYGFGKAAIHLKRPN